MNAQMRVFEERERERERERDVTVTGNEYLGETCSESTASVSASKGDIGFGIATPHHCFNEAKKMFTTN